MYVEDVPVSERAQSALVDAGLLIVRLDLPQVAQPDAAELSRLRAHYGTWTRSQVWEDPIVAAFATFLKAHGTNPKQSPPAGANLLLRFFAEGSSKPLPVIHPIVDVLNIVSARTRIPLAAFDTRFVTLPICLDVCTGVGAPGENTLEAIGGELLTLPEGSIVLRDSSGVLSHFLVRDGNRQKVRPDTTQIWLLSCYVPGVSVAESESALIGATAALRA